MRFFRAGLNHVRSTQVHNPRATTTAECEACRKVLAARATLIAAGQPVKELLW